MEFESGRVPAHVLKHYIPPERFRGISTEFHTTYPEEEYRKIRVVECEEKIDIEEVFSIINSENDSFYGTFMRGDTTYLYRFTYKGNELFDIKEIYVDITDHFPYSATNVTKDFIRSLNIEEFDLETVRKVLIDLRECPCRLARNTLKNELGNVFNREAAKGYTGRGERTYLDEYLYISAVNMGLDVKKNDDAGTLRGKIEKKWGSGCE